MTPELFEKIINYYGEDNIIGISFDNSASITFADGEFSLSNNYIKDLEALRFIDMDSKANPYFTLKFISDIQAIMIKYPTVPFNDYDRVTIRG